MAWPHLKVCLSQEGGMIHQFETVKWVQAYLTQTNLTFETLLEIIYDILRFKSQSGRKAA